MKRAGGRRGQVDRQEGGRWAKGEGGRHREYVPHPPPFWLHHLACTDYISNQCLLPLLTDVGGWLMYAYKDILELLLQLYMLFATLHVL